ncbi:NACHT domain-containing protein [Streptomyces sp. NPDC012510]|uniref:NACHT domain-containing protein n=1 Tax=Streptomyces sp. NPDC012510 TaxID=3364838 RepID=UPI0036F056C4
MPVDGVTPSCDQGLVLTAHDVVGMSVDEAVVLLAAGRARLANAMDGLIGPLYGEQGSPGVLEALLEGFPERVRAAHGVQRCALLQAARIALVAATMAEYPALDGTVNSRYSASALIQEVVNGTTRAGGLTAEDPHLADQRLLEGIGNTLPPHSREVLLDEYLSRASPLAAACPEFALTAGLSPVTEGDAVDSRPGSGLSGLGAMLAGFAGRDERPAAARTQLSSPISSLEPRGPRLPSLAEGYVNPRFRLNEAYTVAGTEHHVASDKWWAEQPLYDSVEEFFAAHLLSASALLAPLVVLGHPGAGKSLLTRLLAARLPADEFRPLRVELRHTPAEADLEEQLEHGLRQATGRKRSWPEWYESQPGAIPVVLLDGFDELLQAGAQRLGSHRQWTYLSDVESFQRREAEQGRPLVVVVTSRTVVADRAAIPTESQVLRLEPFAEPEIDRWLSIWNRTNGTYLKQRGLRPLTAGLVTRHHRELSAQPLLLLMLALHDAVDNALHRLDDEDISRTQLYDRLLTEFVQRQVVKDGPCPPSEQRASVDRELHRLSVIAVGMFHRGAQAISGEEADRDLAALRNTEAHGLRDQKPQEPQKPQDRPRETGPSQTLFGRFFFMHEAQAVVTEERLRSYEFIHATFGEHLTARLIARALDRLVKSSGSGQDPVDDGELYALLSFAPLTDRAQLVQNLREMLAAWPEPVARDDLPDLLAELFEDAAWETPHRTDLGHVPTRLTRTYRDTVYHINLLLIAVLAAGEVHASEFLRTDDVADTWRRHSKLWQSQLSASSWELLSSTLGPHRRWRPGPSDEDDHLPELVIRAHGEPLGRHELSWPLGYYVSAPNDPAGAASRYWSSGKQDALDMVWQVMFTGDRDAELLLHLADPLIDSLPSTLGTLLSDGDGHVHSAAQSLIALMTAKRNHGEKLHPLYLRCLDFVHQLSDREMSPVLELICRQLVQDVPLLSDAALAAVLRRLITHQWARRSALVRQSLRACISGALGRDEALDAVLSRVCSEFDLHSWSSSEPDDLLRLAWTGSSSSTWKWSSQAFHHVAERDFNEILAAHDPGEAAASRPSAVIDLLRLAADLGLDDWLTTHAQSFLRALPPNAFGLLRPSDLIHLRKALPPGTYAAEFAEVERIWRGDGTARDGRA